MLIYHKKDDLTPKVRNTCSLELSRSAWSGILRGMWTHFVGLYAIGAYFTLQFDSHTFHIITNRTIEYQP